MRLGNLVDNYLGHELDLDAHIRSPFEILRTGEYYSGFLTGAHFDFNPGANLLVVTPLIVPRNMTIDRIAIDVEVAAAATKEARLGIYENGTNLYPGALKLDAGVVTVDSTGVKAITISQALTKGLYWTGYVVEAEISVSGVRQLPMVAPLGPNSSGFNTGNGYWTVAHTFGALPDPYTAGGSLATGAPVVPVRILSLD
tara:strand:- start:419 stop:1015 length:597 start_codon:yes stop_codon:yes gene_type:complete